VMLKYGDLCNIVLGSEFRMERRMWRISVGQIYG
jgi:hypothetical protein